MASSRISENKIDYQVCFRNDGFYYFHLKVIDLGPKGVQIKFRYATDKIWIRKDNIINLGHVNKGECYIMEVEVKAKFGRPSVNNNSCPHKFIYNTTKKIEI